jgi:hypothetical protein
MRLITNRPVYRAYRELDEFTDDRCERLVDRITDGLSYWPIVVSVSIVLCAAWMLIAGAIVLYIYERSGFVPASGHWRWLPAPVIDFAMMFVIVGPPPLIALLTRDLVLWLQLRRALTRSIWLTKCRRCGYCLLGQRVGEREGLTCPECGHGTTLTELGLVSAAELLPPADQTAVRLERWTAADRRIVDALDFGASEREARRDRHSLVVAAAQHDES